MIRPTRSTPGDHRRYYRTLTVAIAAMAALLWVAMDQFGITRREIGEQFLAALMSLGLIVLMAALLVGLWVVLRKLFSRRRD